MAPCYLRRQGLLPRSDGSYLCHSSSALRLTVFSGQRVDHVGGAAVTLNPTLLIGPASVVAIPAPAGHAITAAEIKAWEAANGPIQDGGGILLHSGHDAHWPDMKTSFDDGYPTPARDAAEYIVSKKARYVGLETISPDGPNTDTH